MRSSTYYAIAALLFLATVPMYRYILQRAGRPDVAPVHVQSQPARFQQPIQQPAAHQPRSLLDGERCVGGVVVLVSAHSYTSAVGQDGRPVKCEGRYLTQP